MNNDDLMYSDEYAEYVMNNAGGDRIICNGDMLLRAMEDGYLFDEFISSMNSVKQVKFYSVSEEIPS